MLVLMLSWWSHPPKVVETKPDPKAKPGKWTYDDLNKFINSPKGFVPGTAMGFAGIQKDSERADVIAYLNSLSEKPAPLPTAAK